MYLDVVFAADPRFPGGTTSATAMDIRAVRNLGRSVGLLPVTSATLKAARSFHPRLVAEMERCAVTRLTAASPVDCELLLAEHPSLFQHMAASPVRIRPRAALLVANHPPRSGTGRSEYDLAAVLETMERLFGCDAMVVPISPIVRELVTETGIPAEKVASVDLPRLIDPREWEMPIRVPAGDRPLVVGRHARDDPMKWPDGAADILAAWPTREDISVRILGGGPPEAVLDHVPANWRVLPFAPDASRRFLEGIDVYVYFHHRRFVEAFGLAPLEAMAAGKPTILPWTFRPLFDNGAIYAEPSGVPAILDRLRSDPAAYRAQAERGRKIAVERFGPDAFAAPFETIRREALERAGPALRRPAAVAAAAAPSPAPARRVLMVSSNGVGLGHVTRLAAIARRLPEGVEPVFYTLSQGARLVRDLGFRTDYIPSHQMRGFDPGSWNRAFSQEFAAALEFHDPDAVVFDGSMPYAGLVDVLEARPRIAGVWIRRALWKPGQSAGALARHLHFSAVIEPGDLASREDVGGTVTARREAFHVPPVVLVDPADALDRDAARAALDLPKDGRIVALQLGIQASSELAPLRNALVERLAAIGCTIVEILSPLAVRGPGPADPRVMERRAYPLSLHLAAFDLVVTEAGYNSFHEAVLSGTPAIFVPREIEGVDDQALRARYAESAGLGFALERHRLSRVRRILDDALADGAADEIRRRATRLGIENGAGPAARFIAELSSMLKTDRPLGALVDR